MCRAMSFYKSASSGSYPFRLAINRKDTNSDDSHCKSNSKRIRIRNRNRNNNYVALQELCTHYHLHIRLICIIMWDVWARGMEKGMKQDNDHNNDND